MIIQPGVLKLFRISLLLLVMILLGILVNNFISSRQLVTENLPVNGNKDNQTSEQGYSGLGNIENYSEIVERPLFSMDRRPIQVSSNNNVIQASQKSSSTIRNNDELKLSGVILTNDANLAFITSDRGSSTGKYSVGEDISGWELIDIQSHTVTLRQGAETRVLELEVQKSTTKTTTAPPRNVTTQTNEPASANDTDQNTPQNNRAIRQRDAQLAQAIESGQFSPQQLERMENLRQRLRDFQGQQRSGGGGSVDGVFTNDALLFSEDLNIPPIPGNTPSGRPTQ